MRNRLVLFTAILLCGCNLTAPGVSVETSTPNATIQIQSNAELPTPNYPTPAAAQTDWVTYTNAQQGYTIQRPRSVSLVEEQNGNAVYIDDQIEIVMSNTNPEEARDMPILEEVTGIMVGSYAARRLIGSIGPGPGATPQRMERIIVPHNNRYYVFTLYELKRNAWNGDTSRPLGSIPTEERDLFQSILTTLRFGI